VFIPAPEKVTGRAQKLNILEMQEKLWHFQQKVGILKADTMKQAIRAVQVSKSKPVAHCFGVKGRVGIFPQRARENLHP